MTDHQVRTEEKYSKILLSNIYKPATLISILLLIFIVNCFNDEKIPNFENKYNQIKKHSI